MVSLNKLDKLLSLDVKWHISFLAPRNQMYIIASVKGKNVYLHRFITDAPKGKVVDHKNHITLDNTDENLVVCTQFENTQNPAGASKNSKTGILGVSWDRVNEKWRSIIMVMGKQKNLGRFSDINDAIKARKDAEIIYFPYLAEITNRAM